MRLWHYELIPVLPRKQLLAQWRECCAIASNIAKNGTPNHILVNKMLEYPTIHFTVYVNKILKEMDNRSYAVNKSSYSRFVDNLEKASKYFWNYEEGMVINGKVYPDWHEERYLLQCYCNLQEKYDCGMISEDEWDKVYKFVRDKTIINVER